MGGDDDECDKESTSVILKALRLRALDAVRNISLPVFTLKLGSKLARATFRVAFSTATR
jgi:hypothetical protein